MVINRNPLQYIQEQILRREIRFGDKANHQCYTVFKISGHRCEGIYGHSGQCQDIEYPHEKSLDLEYGT